MTARTPNVFVVGAGPVATALAGALRHAGAPVLGLFGRRPDAVRHAAGIAGVAGFSSAPPDLLLEADAVIVAVRDDAIAQVAARVVDTGLITRNHVFLHCSGALSAAEALGAIAPRVGGIATLHPLRSIVDPRQAAATMKGTVFGVEGDEAGRAMAQALVRLLGGVELDIGGSDPLAMALYHAAASMASNFLVALLDAAAAALGAAGPSLARAPEAALRALLPLMAGTLQNLQSVGIERALTGPIARGDAGTVARHLHALGERTPELIPIYLALGRRALAVARRNASNPNDSNDPDNPPDSNDEDSLNRIEKALAEAERNP
jgi:predicted short-subunit dehydrogenase-like oxidoreductase (DUF2520 family)